MTAPIQRAQSFARRPLVVGVVAALALGLFAFLAASAARTHTPTVDEFVYVPTGLYYLRTGDLSFETTNPPLLKMAMSLPLLTMDLELDLDPAARDNSQGWGAWVFGTSFLKHNPEHYLDAFVAARFVVVGISLLLGLLLFVEARRILTPLGALSCLVLYGSMAPLIAHGSLATLDMGLTALIFAAFCAASRFAITKEWYWASSSGALFGLAFATKGTAALFAPVIPLLIAMSWRDRSRQGTAGFVGGGLCMAVAAWVAILGCYGFSQFPLPEALVEGVRFQLAASSGGEYPAFLFGEWSFTGWWYYHLVALLLKTPVSSLVLMFVGAVVVAGRGAQRAQNAWIVLPPLLLVYALSFHYAKDYGIRYLLPAFPFLILLAGRGVDWLLRRGTWARAAVVVMLAWQVSAAAITGPHQLAYFNEMAGGPDNARRLLLDSNLDWGQDLGRLKEFLDARGVGEVCLGYFGHVDPALYGLSYTFPPAAPAAGLCAISANFLAGYPYAITYAGLPIRAVPAGIWSWFDRLEPTARVGRSIYIFDVTEEQAAALATAAKADRTRR